ncbi:MAG: nucleotide exchange factor GrpE [Candidatus Micrarchaeia archaeon]|jgi:molecular chaperone GrpE
MDEEKQPLTEQAASQADLKREAGGEKPPSLGQASQPAHKEGAKKEKKCDCTELTDKCLRIAAEFDNYKKRTAKEKEALALQAESRLMLRLLHIYEEIGLAEREVGKLPESEARKGTLLVLGKLRASFEKEGLLPMKLEGEKLDPFRHEVALREDSAAPEGTIVRVIKQGYLYRGEVLQHAMVSVSSGKKTETEKPEEKQKETKKEGKDV